MRVEVRRDVADARDELLVEVDEGNAKTLCEHCARRTLARASRSDE
jgi:hypothetical protein